MNNKDDKGNKRFILETEPIFKRYNDLEIATLSLIENKLSEGITKEEAEKLLGWVVQNAREAFVEDNDEQIENASLQGYCGFGQGITATTLQNMKLMPKILNVNTNLSSKAGRHAFVSIEMPVIQDNGTIKKTPYLIDTTYRQFLLMNEEAFCDTYINDKKLGDKIPSLPGYWALQNPKGKEFLETILSKGFVELTEENAKIFGDSFVLAAMDRKDNTMAPTHDELETGITGKTYIDKMINPKVQEEIDFDEGELEERGINVATPSMICRKYSDYSLEQIATRSYKKICDEILAISNEQDKEKLERNFI